MYNDVNSWRWSMGNEPLGSVTMWDTGEPNNGYGMESCTVMSSSTWNDMSCATAFSFVCFDGKSIYLTFCHIKTLQTLLLVFLIKSQIPKKLNEFFKATMNCSS